MSKYSDVPVTSRRDRCGAVVLGILAFGGVALTILTLGWGAYEVFSGPFAGAGFLALLFTGVGACRPRARRSLKRILRDR